MAQAVSEAALGELRSAMLGDVITPDHAAYDEARKVWNGVIDRRPALIVRPNGPEEVAAAVAFARRHDLEIAVRGGGHAFGGAGTVDGGVVIDLGAMRQVEVDPQAKIARAGGGAQWGDVDAATQEHGLAVTGGLISHTGVGGLTLGGGMGWLSRKAGLSIDSLVGAEVVTADGRILHASENENSDLFWALRGGGGNFGVVTKFEFRLHVVGPLCHLGFYYWTADRGAEALKFGRDYVTGLSDDFGVLLVGLDAPPAPFVPEQFHGKAGWALLVLGVRDDAEAHTQAVGAVKAAGPDVDFVTPIPYVAVQQLLNEGNEHGLLGYEKAVWMDSLPDEAIDVLTACITERASPLSAIPIFVFGGAFARVPDEATAFSGSRRSLFAVNVAGQTTPDQPEVYERERAWVRRVWQDLVPYASGSGSYVNFMSEYEEDRVRQSYGAKYERLQRIKREYDPENVFHRMAGNIKPAGG